MSYHWTLDSTATLTDRNRAFLPERRLPGQLPHYKNASGATVTAGIEDLRSRSFQESLCLAGERPTTQQLRKYRTTVSSSHHTAHRYSWCSQSTATHQKLIDRPGSATSLVNRPDHQRLTTTAITCGKDSFHAGRKSSMFGMVVGPFICFDSQHI